MDKQLITIPEFLARYSISRTALYREVKAQRLKLLKRGRRSLIAIEDAKNWLDGLRTSTASQSGGVA